MSRCLQQEHLERRRAGIQGEWLDAAALHQTTRIPGAGAIRTEGNAQADPYRLTLGLFDAAVRAGARIFEASAVRRVETLPRGVRAHTGRGSVRARHVIVATGYVAADFKPLLGRFRLFNTYVVATTPLSRAERDELGLPPDVMIWDTGRPYHYARWDATRLVLGGGDRPYVEGAARRRAIHTGAREVRGYFERLFPSLRGVNSEYVWEGLFATTPDGLPYIGPHRRFPGHLFALGYGGNGMTFAFLAARQLLERINGRVTPDHELFAFGRMRS
jgi:glycine/D-amino acid oxidase-like deaminating enzyme